MENGTGEEGRCVQGGAREAQSLHCPGVSPFPELVTAGLRFRPPAQQKLLLQLWWWRQRLAGREAVSRGQALAGHSREGSGIILDSFTALSAV